MNTIIFFVCISHVDVDGECVKGRLNGNGKLEWIKYSCNDESGGGVICAKRNIWEEIPNCYVQPPEEADLGTYKDIPEPQSSQDPVEFCREECQDDSKYFDIMISAESTICHCIDNSVPFGGFLNTEDCSIPICTSDQTPESDKCRIDDGYRRTSLYRTWKTSCPPIDPDLTNKFIYVWEHHGSWHWGSKATLRCIPGYELPLSLDEGEFDVTLRTQTVSCLYDEYEGGKWSNIVPCQPVRCKSLPPPVPSNGTITIVNSLDPLTNDQAETILKYACSESNWAFNYAYDESQPSFAYTDNIHEITISCNYSGYWEYDNGIEGETCINKQPDGTCERVFIPDCHDRSVYCKSLTTPGNATKALIAQPNIDNEYEFGTKIQFTCQQHKHYFDYSVQEDLVSFFYSTNINQITLTCNEHKLWTVQNGINGETCANKKSDNEELWCEDVIIPECVDRAIVCSEPPMPARANIIFSDRPNPDGYEYKTKIDYKCPDRYYFDYPVPDDFISYHYTNNIDNIDVECTQDGNWEVKGGIQGLTCEDSMEVNSDDNSSTIFNCQSLTIPDCEDRTIYCTFPPEKIYGGDVTIDNNPSQFYKKTDDCRWTKWFNTGKGSKGDNEYLLEILSIYTWQVCPNPKDIHARIVGNESPVPRTGGPQIYSKYDMVDGFVCNDEDQIDGSCEDYEVQLCCPFAPEPNTEVSLTCFEENWYLDFHDAPFISSITATCTKNSTWVTKDSEEIFCRDGSLECTVPILPDCQDRTIMCLDELPIPEGLVQLNVSSNQTLHSNSLGASYEYSCEDEGFAIDMPNYPEALIVTCIEPTDYPNKWYYEIWKDGIWEQKVSCQKFSQF